eukprot:361074-Chlamydomonas_euryale.AAC.4
MAAAAASPRDASLRVSQLPAISLQPTRFFDSARIAEPRKAGRPRRPRGAGNACVTPDQQDRKRVAAPAPKRVPARACVPGALPAALLSGFATGEGEVVVQRGEGSGIDDARRRAPLRGRTQRGLERHGLPRPWRRRRRRSGVADAAAGAVASPRATAAGKHHSGGGRRAGGGVAALRPFGGARGQRGGACAAVGHAGG